MSQAQPTNETHDSTQNDQPCSNLFQQSSGDSQVIEFVLPMMTDASSSQGIYDDPLANLYPLDQIMQYHYLKLP